eukprot:gene33319-44603_t
MAARYQTAIIIVTHDEKIIPTFKRLYHIRDGRTHEEGVARQRSEQYFTSPQFFAHARRQLIGRWQPRQIFCGKSDLLPRNAGAEPIRRRRAASARSAGGYPAMTRSPCRHRALGGLLAQSKAGRVKWPCALTFGGAGLSGALLGAHLAKQMDGEKLLLWFALAMTIVAITMLLPKKGEGDPGVHLTPAMTLKLAPVGLGTGLAAGFFGIGGGYATGGEGFILEASVEEKNFLGRGQYIRVSASGGALTRNYAVSFTEPYFLGYRLAAGFDLFKSESHIYDNYDYQDQGFSLRVTAPITNDLTTTFRYNYKSMDYTSDNEAALSQPYQHLVNHSPWMTSSVSASVNYNTLDTQTLPHEGIVAAVTQEFAGLGGDSDFYKLSGKARVYYTLSDDMDLVGSLSGAAGHVISITGKPLNIFDQFTLDSNDIRGFADTGVGPRMKKNDDPIGGTTFFTASAEVTFPLPGVSQDSGFRGGFFMDAGTLYGNDVKINKG